MSGEDWFQLFAVIGSILGAVYVIFLWDDPIDLEDAEEAARLRVLAELEQIERDRPNHIVR